MKDHNLKGDGLTMGGHFVFNRSGEVVFKHVEKTFGDHPETSEVRSTMCYREFAEVEALPLVLQRSHVCEQLAPESHAVSACY